MVNEEKEKELVSVIDISNEENIKYWITLLNCTREDLIHAVLQVGNIASKVDTFLTLNRLKSNF